MRQPLVAGNWKMNGSLESIRSLVDGLLGGIDSVAQAQVAVCPPFVYLSGISDLLRGTPIAWGAQNVSHELAGAFTGEVSVSMLKDFDCRYVIVGHSERRSLYGETDAIVAAKFRTVVAAKLVPILCVGETLAEREAGVTATVVERQLDAVLGLAGVATFAQAVIAYEPVWAIGTGRTASREQAQEVHALIRARIADQDAVIAQRIQILYGGSVKADNAAELFGMPDIDGGLIGGASLKVDEFLTICRAAR